MHPKKSNKITEIVRLQQMLKKWKRLAVGPTEANSNSSNNNSTNNKSKKFLKKTFSFSDISSASSEVPKGFLAVSVGEEMKRFVIPTAYLTHRAFSVLLREAEEEFGFQQEGVLRLPCEVSVFERVLKVVEEKKEVFYMNGFAFDGEETVGSCCSSEAEVAQSRHIQNPMCR
ncbi:hypothetical protein QJS04_geneDACA004137 [Acorus gramineus]|uniref:Uncharacterized protein n=1 Tax=Acorus gramineus TaxID=55184 RepID=A0AAV9BIF7_ACOGR|nr:hypothetical protein QJS04_geneDACA004137 [Acorus gramineus]